MRCAAKILMLLPLLVACDSSTDGVDTASAAPADLPPLTVTLREVRLHGIVTHQPPAGSSNEVESWAPEEGEMFVIVKAELGHNKCTDGEHLEGKDASLTIDGKKIEHVGGGPTERLLCVGCLVNDKISCENDRGSSSPYYFIFGVADGADVSKGTFKYRDKEVPLSGAKIDDLREQDTVDIKIKARRDEIKKLKKKLENMPSESAGRLVLADIEEIKATIRELEKKKRKKKRGRR